MTGEQSSAWTVIYKLKLLIPKNGSVHLNFDAPADKIMIGWVVSNINN